MEQPKKKRISTLAKAYSVTSEVLLGLLKSEGITVKSAASMIDSDTFAIIKPALVKEKKRIERQEMAKAGIKIPMKAVLKKSRPEVKAKIVKAPEPAEVIKTEVSKEKEPSKVSKPEDSKIPEAAEPVADTVVEIKKSIEIKKAAEEAEPADVVIQEENKKESPDEKVPLIVDEPDFVKKDEVKPELKVTIEKPDEKLAARIQKYMSDKQIRKNGTGKGYSGKFGKVPTVQKKQRKVETSSGSQFQDVFAVRAQQAGVVFPVGGFKPGAAKDSSQSKKKGLKKRGKIKKTKEQIEQELSAAKSSVNKVMATLKRGTRKVKHQKEKSEDNLSNEKKILEVAEFITISELAGLMNVMPNQVIAKCMELGMMVTINQRLDHETIAVIADEFGFAVKLMEEYEESVESDEEEADEADMVLRAPVVTIMGHVDHGKTSILDFIRKSNIVSGETGGITQHIGAYQVDTPSGSVCFLDTPGHQAFAAMRSRGAQITDVVVLVVAADSMVMPQTKESIQHARNANVKIVVAINKCDLPNANVDKIKNQLAEEGVQIEEWGGTVSCVEISAKTGHNIDKLLQVLAAEAELLELRAVPGRNAKGTVIETRLDKGKGPVASVLVQDGTLKIGDTFVCGSYSGKVRSLLNEYNKRIISAGPAVPVQVLGLEGLPQPGDSFVVMSNEKEAREVASRRREAAKDRELRQKRHITLEQLHEQIEAGEFHELKVIIKGDVDGSVEAIASSLESLSTVEVKVNIINRGVGAVKEADVHLAAAADAIIIAFHVLPSESVRNLAEEEGVTINYYRVIYDIVDEILSGMEGMLNPEFVEKIIGEARILQIFKVPKIGFVAGSLVTSGLVDRDSQVRLYRGGIEIGEARVTSLKRLKDDVKSVKSGLECGIGIEGLKDLKDDDVLAFFKKVEVARKLSSASKT